MQPPWRRYGAAVLLAILGLMATAVTSSQLARWARARDEERFTAEAGLIVGMIEQKMERYESAMGRLSDAFAPENGEVSERNWSGWTTHTLGLSYHFPNVVCLVVAPRITGEQRAAFAERAKAQVTGHPGTITTARPKASESMVCTTR